MSGRKRKIYKNSQFMFGNPRDAKEIHGCGGDFVENVNSVFDSWLNLKRHLYGVANIEVETSRNMLSDLFQTKECNSTTENIAKKSNYKKGRSRVCVIDLDKLNDSLILSDDEKATLKKILRRLESKKRKAKPNERESKRSSRNNPFSFSSQDGKSSKVRNSQSKTKQNKTVHSKQRLLKVTTVCSECQREKYLKKYNRALKKSIKISEEKLLKSFLELNPESFKNVEQFQNSRRSSSCSISSGAKQSIKINNIQFKYLNPTYVVQYSGNQGEEENNNTKDRLCSQAALAANLGQRRMTVHEPRPSHRNTVMHYDDSRDVHVIGLGQGTQEMIKERHNSKTVRNPLSISDPGISYPRFPQERNFCLDENEGVSTRTTPGRNVKQCTRFDCLQEESEGEIPPSKNSMCKKFKLFLRKCLCLSHKDGHEASSKRKRVPVKRFQGYPQTDHDRPYFKKTTEKEFFEGDDMGTK